MSNYTLKVKVNSEDRKLIEYYENYSLNYEGDSGIDLMIPNDYVFRSFDTHLIDLNISCEMLDENGRNVSYYLYPRSSIYKTNLRLCNSVGIIDAGYRGNIKAAFQYMKLGDENLDVERGNKLVQICGPNLGNIRVEVVKELNDTERGNKGFGSTGK